jgi:hypothetical protein
MPFTVSLSDLDGLRDTESEFTLTPGPTTVEYGTSRYKYNIIETDAGVGIQQRTKLNATEMKWVWSGYGVEVPYYENLYNTLFALQASVRKLKNLSPFVYLKEDVSLEFGKYNDTTTVVEPAWIRVLVTHVHRVASKGGGKVRYDTTELRFIIADPTITIVQ